MPAFKLPSKPSFEDLRHALRLFLRTPLFTSIAVLTLAIGIGATTTVFSVVDRILFRSLPYKQPDRLVSWGVTGPIDESEFMLGKSYVDSRNFVSPFESVTSLSPELDRVREISAAMILSVSAAFQCKRTSSPLSVWLLR